MKQSLSVDCPGGLDHGELMKRAAAGLVLLLVLCGCASTPSLGGLALVGPTSDECASLWRQIPRREPLGALDILSRLSEEGCDQETVLLGRKIRDTYRDKYYSVTAEAAEFVAPGGSTVPYVLEGYERSYLGLLIARSFLRLGRTSDAQVELRRVDEDRKAAIYNSTEDPIVAVLLAVMWEKCGEGDHARAYWKQVFERPGAEPVMVEFAEAQIRRLDRGEVQSSWTVRAVGSFPEVGWKLGEGGDKAYKLTVAEAFPAACASSATLKASTSSWLQELNGRYSMKRTPLQAVRTTARAAVGIAAGATLIVGGIFVMVAGCSDSKHGGCSQATEAGFDIMKAGVSLGSALAQPDLRHWKRVPSAFVLSMESEPRSCEGSMNARLWL